MAGAGAKSHAQPIQKYFLVHSRMYSMGVRSREGTAMAATICWDRRSMTWYLPGQKEAIFLILDFAVSRSGEVSSQIEVLTSRRKMSKGVVSIIVSLDVLP